MSVLRFVALVTSVLREILVAEQAVQARLLRAPMDALGPGLLPFLLEVEGDALCVDLWLMVDIVALRYSRAHADVLRDIEACTGSKHERQRSSVSAALAVASGELDPAHALHGQAPCAVASETTPARGSEAPFGGRCWRRSASGVARSAVRHDLGWRA